MQGDRWQSCRNGLNSTDVELWKGFRWGRSQVFQPTHRLSPILLYWLLLIHIFKSHSFERIVVECVGFIAGSVVSRSALMVDAI